MLSAITTPNSKAWVAGLVAWLGQLLSTKLGWGAYITPEIVGLIAGVVTYWVPNLAPSATTESKP